MTLVVHDTGLQKIRTYENDQLDAARKHAARVHGYVVDCSGNVENFTLEEEIRLLRTRQQILDRQLHDAQDRMSAICGLIGAPRGRLERAVIQLLNGDSAVATALPPDPRETLNMSTTLDVEQTKRRRRQRATSTSDDDIDSPPPPPPPHGTHKRYYSRKYNCRCEACTHAYAVYRRDKRNAKRQQGDTGPWPAVIAKGPEDY